jgi:hypothetical protein
MVAFIPGYLYLHLGVIWQLWFNLQSVPGGQWGLKHEVMKWGWVELLIGLLGVRSTYAS